MTQVAIGIDLEFQRTKGWKQKLWYGGQDAWKKQMGQSDGSLVNGERILHIGLKDFETGMTVLESMAFQERLPSLFLSSTTWCKEERPSNRR